jgi:hypothetical protein
MGGLLNANTVMMCPHGGSVTAISSDTRAQAVGGFLLRPSDTYTIAGCPFNLGPAGPHPCVQVQWVQAALQSKAMGDATLNTESVGLCLAADQAVQGTVLITVTQPRVQGR